VVSAASLIVRVSVATPADLSTVVSTFRPPRDHDRCPSPGRASSYTVGSVEIGAILSEAWGLYTRFFGRFVIVAGVVYLALGAISTIIEESAPSGDGGRALAALVAAVVSFIGYFWIQGVLVVLTADVRDGVADDSFSQLFARVRPHLGALILAGILAGLGIVVGFILLIVPGLYLLTRWSMIGPAILLERVSAAASFTRSHELVRGRAWPVFGILLVLFLVNVIAGGIIVGLVAAMGGGAVGNWIGTALASTVVAPFIAIATTLVYFRLSADRPADARPADPAPTF
jgi:hypothetical protein